MATQYQPLPDAPVIGETPSSAPRWTIPLSGYLYLKFIQFEGFGAEIDEANLPGVSLVIEGEENSNSLWKPNDKKKKEIFDILLFVSSVHNKVRVSFWHPQGAAFLGEVLIEPLKIQPGTASAVWLPINDTCRVFTQLWWSNVQLSDKISNKPRLGRNSGLVLLDRKLYHPGETVRGIVIYKTKDPITFTCLRLSFKSISYQRAYQDYAYDFKHTLYRRSAILIAANREMSSPVTVNPGVYTWAFELPLLYTLPPSDIFSGNSYYMSVASYDGNKKTQLAKHKFDVVKVIFPQNLLSPALDQNMPLQTSSPAPAPSPTTASPANNASASNTTAETNMAKSNADSNTANSGELSFDSDEDSILESRDSSSDDSSEDSPKKTKTEKVKDAPKESSSPSKASGKPEIDMTKSSNSKKVEPAIESFSGDEDSSDDELEQADKKKSKQEKQEKPKKLRRTTSTGSLAESAPDLFAAQTKVASSGVLVRVPLRVTPGIRINLRPSDAVKHIVVPVTIKNTLQKPIKYVTATLKANIVKIVSRASGIIVASQRPSITEESYVQIINTINLKNQPGLPIAPGATWQGNVTYTVPENLPPSIEIYNSPLFRRTYYVSVKSATSKGMFSKSKLKQRILIRVGSYDFDTRPLPVQHSYNITMNYKIYTLARYPYLPMFSGEIPVDAGLPEGSETWSVVDLETSTAPKSKNPKQ